MKLWEPMSSPREHVMMKRSLRYTSKLPEKFEGDKGQLSRSGKKTRKECCGSTKVGESSRQRATGITKYSWMGELF